MFILSLKEQGIRTENRGRGGCAEFRRRSGGTLTVLLVFALVILAFAGAALYAYQSPDTRMKIFSWRLEGVKLADYSSDVAVLIKNKRYEEAEKLAVYINANPDLPGQESVRELRVELDERIKKSTSLLERGFNLVSGFISGGGSTPEERVGGLIANILINNGGIAADDLPKSSRDSTDKLVNALDRASLGPDGAWFPGTVCTLRISGLLTPEYENFLMDAASRSEQAGRCVPELQNAVNDTRALAGELGIHRSLGVHAEVKNSGDINVLASWSKVKPDETYIVATHGGLSLLYKLPDTTEGRELLSKIAQRGKPAIDSAGFWLK